LGVPTKSSSQGLAPNGRARLSVVVGVLAAAVLPVTIAVAETSELLELPDAALAIPVAAVLGLAALVLGGRARVRVERTLGRVGGVQTAHVGRGLGLLALALAAAALIALGANEYLQRYD